MKLTELDKNFQTLIPDEQGFVYRDVLSGTFALEGLPWHTSNKETYYRFPERLTEKEVNRGALELAHNTSGACIRFKTNSTEIILKAELAWDLGLKHNVGRRGFDSYIRHPDGSLTFHRLVRPGPQDDSVIGSCAQNPSGVMREYWINLPPYGGVTKIEIGLKAEAQLEAPPPHAIPKPILFYGSSITQGGCASRPGNAYTSMLCRTLDAEQINLGFSGCGKGEPAVAEAIAELDLAAFVLDYDHNAPTVEHLEATHSNFFKIIRAKHPELPRDPAGLADYSDMSDPDAVDKSRRFKWNGDEVIVNFGKYAGRTLRDIAENEPGFLRWIIKNDFPEDVRDIAGNALLGKFPERKNNGDQP